MNGMPIINIQEKTLAKAFETALISLYENGTRILTQYDREDDPLSIDATANITILEPLCDPMIHKAFPGGIDTLREYVLELQGYKNHWVKNMNDPDDTRWEYTYNQRLTDWGTWYEKDLEGNRKKNGLRYPVFLPLERQKKIEYGHDRFKYAEVNQIEKVLDKLVKDPFTRQAQMITWMPFMDFEVYDAPCLQSIWFRLTNGKRGKYTLSVNIRFRSNDAWKAFFMNSFGFIQFILSEIVRPLEKRFEKSVYLGRINWQADSFHIYGRDISEFKAQLYDKWVSNEPFEKRIMNFHNDLIQEIWMESKQQMIDKINRYDEEHK